MEYLILAAALLILFVIYLIRCSLEEKKLWKWFPRQVRFIRRER